MKQAGGAALAGQGERDMTTAAVTFYETSVGKKVVMAVSGFIVFGFVLVHMLGNLQVFQGPEKLNSYAAFLHSLGGLLWVFRIVLAVAVVAHIVSATQLTLQSWSARPQGYRARRFRQTTYAARTMRWGGPIIGLFLLYHLGHLTIGCTAPAGTFDGTVSAAGGLDVYNNVVRGFQVWWVSAIYIVAVVAVGLHLYHGLWSMFQSVGLVHPGNDGWRRPFAALFAALVTLGNLSIPLAVLAGVVTPV